MTHMYLLGDVSRLLGVEPYRIVYLFSSGQLPEPPRFGGRRVFFSEHVDMIAQKLSVEVNNMNHKENV